MGFAVPPARLAEWHAAALLDQAALGPRNAAQLDLACLLLPGAAHGRRPRRSGAPGRVRGALCADALMRPEEERRTACVLARRPACGRGVAQGGGCQVGAPRASGRLLGACASACAPAHAAPAMAGSPRSA